MAQRKGWSVNIRRDEGGSVLLPTESRLSAWIRVLRKPADMCRRRSETAIGSTNRKHPVVGTAKTALEQGAKIRAPRARVNCKSAARPFSRNAALAISRNENYLSLTHRFSANYFPTFLRPPCSADTLSAFPLSSRTSCRHLPCSPTPLRRPLNRRRAALRFQHTTPGPLICRTRSPRSPISLTIRTTSSGGICSCIFRFTSAQLARTSSDRTSC